VVEEVIELRGGELFVVQQVVSHAGVGVAGAGAHNQATGGREAHCGVEAVAIAHSAQAVHREFDARRAAVEGQHAAGRGFLLHAEMRPGDFTGEWAAAESAWCGNRS
jgi:hypothetical protein